MEGSPPHPGSDRSQFEIPASCPPANQRPCPLGGCASSNSGGRKNRRCTSQARVLISVLTSHRLRVLDPEHGKFCIVLLNTQCEEVPMKIGATSISFRPKVFSDPASVVD